MDNAFIAVLEKLKRTNDLTQEQSNEIIKEKFPDLEFLDANEKKSKTLFRKLVPWKLQELKEYNLVKVLKLLNVIYPKLYTNKTTLDNMFSTDVRKPISTRFGVNSKQHKEAKKLAALSYADKGAILKEQKDKVVAKNENRVQYPMDKILGIISENIVSEDLMKRAVALLLASGSRPIELFVKSNYTVEDEHFINQDHIAKKKGEEFSVIKPVLFLTSQRFVGEVARMRTDLKERYPKIIQKNGQLSASINSRGNFIAKQIFSQQEDFTLYTCRKLYGLLSYDLYGKSGRYGDNPSIQTYLSRVLGHNPNSLMTSFNYSHFELEPDPKTVAPNELIAEQALLKVKIEELEKRFDQEGVPERPEADNTHQIANKEIEKQFEEIKKVADHYKATRGRNISQALLEKLARKLAPRRVIRLWHVRHRV